MAWSNGLAHWVDSESNTAFISVAFSWRIREARRIAEYYANRGFRVRVGGTILLVPQNAKPFEGIATVSQDDVGALVHHNSQATIASRGCPVNCWFCILRLENRYLKLDKDGFQLLPDFTPRSILCDNNLSALPVEYQNHIIQRYQGTNVPLLDANSGFDPSAFDEDCYQRWKAINKGVWRFAFDEMKEARDVERMARILKNESPRKKQVYVLIGNEPIAPCYERVMKVRAWGCETHCQAILPLNAQDRHAFKILHDWTPLRLIDFMRWSNNRFMRHVKLWEYSNRKYELPLFTRQMLGVSI